MGWVETERLSGAVLAGGQSRRMGTDKALLPLRAGDPPLAALVLARVREVADDVFVVAPDRPGYAALGVPVVPDAYDDAGTLGGIATALRAARHDRCLVVACDLPFLSVPLLRWLAEQPMDVDALVPRIAGQSRQGGTTVFQTLHAIYRRSCLAPIERRLGEGRRQIVGFFDEVRVRAVEEAELRRHDPELRSFFNANTPEAAAEARLLLAASDGAERPRPGG